MNLFGKNIGHEDRKSVLGKSFFSCGLRLLLLWGIVNYCLSLPLLADSNVGPQVRFSLDFAFTPPKHVILVGFTNASGGIVLTGISLKEGRPLDANSYTLQVKSGQTESSIALSAEPTGVENGFASGLVLTPPDNTDLSVDRKYSLKIKQSALVLTEGPNKTAALNPNNDLEVPLDTGFLELDKTFVRPAGLQNKLEILAGTGGGNSSVRYSYRVNQVKGRKWLNAELLLKGDFNFQSAQKTKYFNSLNGELKLFTSQRWSFPWTPADKKDAKARYSEFDVHVRLDSDQTFDNADKVIGATAATYLRDPVSGWLGSRLILNGFKPSNEATVSPLLILGYDFADELKSDATTRKINTSAGNHRLQSSLYWSLPLGRELDWSLVGISKRINADALVELNGIYDLRADKFLDQSRFSLNFWPQTANGVKTVYTLSWERGKAGPTFNDVQAILAGLKVSF